MRASPRRAVQRRGVSPAIGETDAGPQADLADIMACRVKAHMRPFEVEHLTRHGDLPLVARQRRGMGEARLDSVRACRQIDMEGKALQRIAPPAHGLAIDQKPQVHQLIDRAAGAVMAGQPLRQLQDHFACTGRDGHHLADLPQPPRGVAGIDIQRDRAAGIGGVLRVGYIMRDGQRAGRGSLGAITGEGWCRGGDQQGDGGKAGGDQGLCHAPTWRGKRPPASHLFSWGAKSL